MDLNEFLARLAETPRRWRLSSQHGAHLLRCDHQCPILAVAADRDPDGPRWRLREWPAAAAQIGLAPHDAQAIAIAADHFDSPSHYDLRAALLRACSLA